MYDPTEQLDYPRPSDGADATSRDALRPGTRLAEFEIMGVLGTGGFGIVYLAMDHALMRQVAIKEYMPTALANRALGDWVAVRSPSHAETFAVGLQSFINEAQLLAGFDHPSLLKVHRFWEGNGTAYMVMQYYAGRTLKEERALMTRPPNEAWLWAFIEPILGALEVLHGEGVYHRDISPDNILLQQDGPPVLLDFGAARRVIGDRTQTLTAILKPNFAPIEQYADIADMRQGPWTDLYAVGAVVYYMLTGKAPTPAVARAVRDGLPTLVADAALPEATSSAIFLRAVDWALAVAPNDRPQNAQQFREALNGLRKPPLSADELKAKKLARKAQTRTRGLRLAAAVAGLAVLTVATWAYRARPQNDAAVIADLPVVKTGPANPSGTAPLTGANHGKAQGSKGARTGGQEQPMRSEIDNTPVVAMRSPSEVCAGRNFFTKNLCITRECATARFQQHPQCVKLHQDNEAWQSEQRRIN